MSPKILSDKAISLEMVRDLLKERSNSADLNYIQRITLDFCHRFSEYLPKAEEFIELLGNEFNLSREDAIQIINIDPTRIEEVNLVLEDKIPLEERKRLLDLIKEHKEKYKDIEEEVPSDISAASFDEADGKEDYPDEEPIDGLE